MGKMSSPQKARAAFGSAVLLILLSGLAASITISKLRSAQEWVVHGHDVEIAIADLNTIISRSGRLRAEYIASGAADRIGEFEDVVARIPDKLRVVEQLTVDNPVQQAHCVELRRQTEERIRLMRQAVNLKKSGQSNLENQANITQQIVAVAAETDVLSQQMDSEESRLLEKRTANAERWFAGIVMILAIALALALILFWVHYTLLNDELLALEHAQKSLRGLSARLMNVQDGERRKFSRELHDSLGQELAALKMLLPMVDKSTPGDPTLAECLQIVDKSIAETRTISHLLHPPLLDEAGLAVAVKWYVDGFAQRSKLDVKVEIPDDLGRLPSATELTLFRVLQEGLTNIHRHSGASKAEVTVSHPPGKVILRIRDFGKGVPRATLERFRTDATGTGVGLAGMRERVRELDGQFEIDSDHNGTVIVVTVPVEENGVDEEPLTRVAGIDS
jgi:signal transduction histidine kinase